MRLDSKTARRIATGTLKVQRDESKAVFQGLLNSPRHGLKQKTSQLCKRVESNYREILGNGFIADEWNARTYICVAFEIQESDDGRPLQLAINLRYLNARSNVEGISIVALITMHAMERLMERGRDTDLFRLAHAEFDKSFLAEIGLNQDASKLPINEEFRIKTPHGFACGIVSEKGIPIVRTWIHRPGI
jgi:hypothetical protein